MKKSIKIALVLLITFLFSTSVFAASVASGDATMVLVEDNVCTIEFGKYGSFEKKLERIDTQNKTIDIRLTAKNNQEQKEKPTPGEPREETIVETTELPGEVVLLIDVSNSMSVNQVNVSGTPTTRKQLVVDAARQLVSKLFTANPDIKIGVVEFATSPEVSERGTAKDARAVTTALTNSQSEVSSALDTVSQDVMGPQTNIQIGLRTADALLATSTDADAKKFIIVLTDAIPNTAEGVTFDTYTDASATPTKNELVSIKNKGINVISMLINMKEDEIAISQESPKPTYRQVAEKIFGTSSRPTAGPVYYVEDEEVTSTIAESIYNDLVVTTERTVVIEPDPIDDSEYEEYVLTDIVIKDYFPQNIIDNFDFALLTEPEKGTVTAKVDRSDNSITWTISELKPGESATFVYRLTIKNTISSEIIGVNLPTNKDVTIDYKENDIPGDQVHNDKCPIVALDVVAKKEIPQTGSNTWLIVGTLVSLAGIISALSFRNVKKIRSTISK